MARIRTVKPELFLDEELGGLTGDHLALFVGLWTLADKEGRMEDRPVRIKAALFPYRPVDVDALLRDLDGIGKVVRYVIEGVRYLAVPGFAKHQRPHPKEPPSTIPKPDLVTASREKKRQEITNPPVIPSSPVGREGKGREGVLGREGNGADAPAPTKPPPRPPADASDIEQRINETFATVRGRPYRWGLGDLEALKLLLGEGESPDEVVRRLGNGLRRTKYPAINSVADLGRHWNACAQDEPANGTSRDWKKGRVGAEEIDKAKLEKTGDISDAF